MLVNGRCHRRSEDVEDDIEDIDIEGKQERRRKEKKKDEKDAKRRRLYNKQQQSSSSSSSLKRTDDDGRALLFSAASIHMRWSIEQEGREDFERKARWKAKVEEAKKRKKTMKRTKETQGKSDEEKEEEEEEEEEEKDIADAWVQYDLHPLYSKAFESRIYIADADSEKVLHPAIKGRMDIVGAAETGSGKTMAFGLAYSTTPDAR